MRKTGWDRGLRCTRLASPRLQQGDMWGRVWGERDVALRMLALLGAQDVARLIQAEKTCRRAITRELRRFRRGSARLGLAMWFLKHGELEFQSYYQELETHQIARSSFHDPRVPPRVVSQWAERGKVPGGCVRLRPEPLPKRSERGVMMRFIAPTDQKPMLTSVVQNQRRIYTVVTLQITKQESDANGEGEETDPVVLRRLWYLKEFDEWRAMVPAAEKRLLDAHGALCRYDLVSHDGGLALELDVLAGVDSLMDYYLVKRATVALPLEELLHPFFKSLSPPLPLPPPSVAPLEPHPCVVTLSFAKLNGDIIATHSLKCEMTVERQREAGSAGLLNGEADARDETTTEAASRPRTGVEHFDIVTIKAASAVADLTVPVPQDPGFIWLSVLGHERTPSTPRRRYYSTCTLHSGAKRQRALLSIDAQWVPGVLESFPTLQSRRRRHLKGFLRVSCDLDTHELRELSIVAQHLPAERLRPYAASIESYTRQEAVA